MKTPDSTSDKSGTWNGMRHFSALQADIFLFPTDIDHPLGHIISEEERQRASRFHFERDRKRHVACRATMRLVLAERLGLRPEEIQFSFNPYGKPSIENCGKPVYFNLSHSGNLAVLAVTDHAVVGVDIERIRDLEDWKEIASRYYSVSELAWIESLPRQQRMRGFYRLWTMKEAVLKADGRGLSFPLHEIEILLGSGLPTLARGHWRLQELDLTAGYAASIAMP